MSLIVYDLFGEKRDKVRRTIDLVRSFEPPDKYYLAYSGGKDSIVVEAILRMAGVGYDIHYNMTTVDPPELVRFVIRQFEAVIYDLPDGSFKYLPSTAAAGCSLRRQPKASPESGASTSPFRSCPCGS